MFDRRVDYLPLTDIRQAPRNPKRHDHDGIRRSLERHGLAELPLIDERTGRLVAGHGRIEQAAALHAAGQQPPDGIHVADDGETWLIPVIRGWSSHDDAHAAAYTVASNRLTETGGWDDRDLAAVLDDLAAADTDLLESTGFDEAHLDDLHAVLEEHTDLADTAPAGEPSPSSPRPRAQPTADAKDPLAGQQSRFLTLEEMAANYDQSASRMIVLAYEGGRYVWMVDSLTELGERLDVDTNAEVVMRLVQDATGQQAPDA